MNLLFAVLIGVIVFCVYLAIDQKRLDIKRRESMRARIAPDGTNRGLEHEESLNAASGEPSTRARMLLGLLSGLGVNTEETIRKLEPRFGQAGIHSPDAPIHYLFFQRIVSIFFAIAGAMIVLQKADGMAMIQNWAVGGFILVLAIFGPFLYLQNKIDHRRKKLERAFPDTLDLLLICVESGLALDAALNRVCNELGTAYPEMTEELNRPRLELALINDRVRALLNLGERTNMVAFRSLVAALIQSERFGTSLTDTLRVLSEDFRLLRLSHAEAKAARLPVLLTIPLVFFLLPSFVLIVLGPAIVAFVRQGSILTGNN